MTAQEAKAITFSKLPPLRPSDELMGRIAYSASVGCRFVIVESAIEIQEEWWLDEAGYSVTTTRLNLVGGPYTVETRIEW